MSAPTAVMDVQTSPVTGQLTGMKVCAWCEKENEEFKDVVRICVRHHFDYRKVSHGICARHYQINLEKRMGETE